MSMIIENFGKSICSKMLRFARQDAKRLIADKQRELSNFDLKIQPTLLKQVPKTWLHWPAIVYFTLAILTNKHPLAVVRVWLSFYFPESKDQPKQEIDLLNYAMFIGMCVFVLGGIMYCVREKKEKNISQAVVDQLNDRYQSTLGDIPWFVDTDIKQVLDDHTATTFAMLERYCKQDVELLEDYSQQLDGFVHSLRGRDLSRVPMDEISKPHLKTFVRSRLLTWNTENASDAVEMKQELDELSNDGLQLG